MAIWYSLDSRCKPKPVEGTTDSQEVTGDEICWRERRLQQGGKKLVSIIPDKTFWVGLGEARVELTEMALGSETLELNATTAC